MFHLSIRVDSVKLVISYSIARQVVIRELVRIKIRHSCYKSTILTASVIASVSATFNDRASLVIELMLKLV